MNPENVQDELLNGVDEKETRKVINMDRLEGLSSDDLEEIARLIETNKHKSLQLKRPEYDTFNIAVYSPICKFCDGKQVLANGSVCTHCNGEGRDPEKEYPVVRIGTVKMFGRDIYAPQFVDINYLDYEVEGKVGTPVTKQVTIPYISSKNVNDWCGCKLVTVNSIAISQKQEKVKALNGGNEVMVSLLGTDGRLATKIPCMLTTIKKVYTFEYKGRAYNINSKYVNPN